MYTCEILINIFERRVHYFSYCSYVFIGTKNNVLKQDEELNILSFIAKLVN